ncbi:MAG TPA: TetR/AcrR family transcriptional regulator [Solirubrobacteraceae bacterium]|jgi:AcrR family transcriptional regulator
MLAPRRRQTGDLQASDPRERILAAMVATVARRGLARTTVGRVTLLAGVPEALFHEHFEDRDDCFLAAIDEILTDIELLVLRSFSRPVGWPQRVKLGLRALLDAIASYPDGAKAAVVESYAATDQTRERYSRTLRMLVPLIEEGRPLARYPDSLTEQASHAIVGGIASIVHRRVLEDRTDELPSLLGELTFFALMPFLGNEHALEASGMRSKKR